MLLFLQKKKTLACYLCSQRNILTPVQAKWYAAARESGEKLALPHANKAAVVHGMNGFFLGEQAWRRSVPGVVSALFPVFWGVQKT